MEVEGGSTRLVEVEGGGSSRLLVKCNGGKSIDFFVVVVMMSVLICFLKVC